MTPCLQVQALAKAYGPNAVLHNVSFAVDRKEHVILTGPSGGGKSALLRIIAGLETPSEGHVLINGAVVSDTNRSTVPAHRRGVGMVFQDLGLWPNLTAAENIQLAFGTGVAGRAERRRRTTELLWACHIESIANRLPEMLSAGEQQRVALARSLAGRPRILLLDEPFGPLDQTLRAEFFDLIQGLCANDGTTVITVTHDLADAWGLQADRILVLEQGVICDNVSLGLALTIQPTSKTLQNWQRLAIKMRAVSQDDSA
jgi:iron(III) transport system ATP-binding protein